MSFVVVDITNIIITEICIFLQMNMFRVDFCYKFVF